jgi:hypothetical protein
MRVRKGFVREHAPGGRRESRAALGKSGLRVRAIRLRLKNGEPETPVTNIGEGGLGYEAFADLYHRRRGIETKYETVKQKPELENFSGKLAEHMKQDFYAMMTAANTLSGAVRQADAAVKRKREGRENKYGYR